MYEPFGEVFTGRAKNFNMNKLQSSTTYKFRLIAENELGRSRPSEIVAFQTQGTAPPKPQPPGLKEAAKSTLHLVWSKRLSDCVSNIVYIFMHIGSTFNLIWPRRSKRYLYSDMVWYFFLYFFSTLKSSGSTRSIITIYSIF